MIELEAVSKAYSMGERTVFGVKDIDLVVEEGSFVVVVGPSGCGKTTLLNLIGGIDSPTEGTITVSGKEISSLDDGDLTDYRKKELGFVFQFFNLISTLTARENVELSLNLRGVDGEESKEKAREFLDLVDGSDFEDRFPSELSGGEQQRVAIARALAKKPSVLLVDEPTGNLDVDVTRKVMSALCESTEELGITTIMVTHDLPLAKLGNRIIELKDGRIAGDKINEERVPPEELEW
ncbi:hypothetical protein AKJ66_00100 [candidate division MSBL1 archaeon SCGC-AAA259E22]|uniref:ABC transporter domain-containing protein n=1 Tax=candidate division MSBL1 archaeon SCGC-AAA259E22 TaxID=1698265 RepID=A0A133UID1_9EURY|nr:hypothetical protein AKJ66_00100 [candidate division MSBL1 archaeon SCGC-AAA259E22]